MGAWGAGNFDNDSALDWVCSLEGSTGLSVVEAAISGIVNCGGLLDADVGCTGLAAAEVIAALRDKPCAGLPQEVSQWVDTHKIVPGDALVQDCLAAVDRIRSDARSELRELWEESEEPPTEWYSVLDDLAARLQ